jgi:hypothetical protein
VNTARPYTRQCLKGLPATNTLAYYELSLIMAVKSFITLTNRLKITKKTLQILLGVIMLLTLVHFTYVKGKLDHSVKNIFNLIEKLF